MARPNAPEPTAKLWWAKASTRWHVYPTAQPEQLVAHDWYGTWCPFAKADGSVGWYLSPTSFEFQREAWSPALQGHWVTPPRVPFGGPAYYAPGEA